MATIGVMLFPEQGAYNASLRLLKQLRQRGHRICLVGTARFAEQMAAAGFDFDVVRADHFDSQKVKETRAQAARLPLYRRGKMLLEDGHRMVETTLDDLGEWADRLQPDIMLIDQLAAFPYALPFAERGIPLLGINTTISSIFQPGLTPCTQGGIPRRSDASSLARLPHLARWSGLGLKFLALKLTVALVAVLYGNRKYQECLRRFAAAGACLKLSEYGYRLQLPELVLAPREFDFPVHARLRSVTYAGTCVDWERQEPEFDWSPIEQGKPLVYCALGTYVDKYPHARRLVRAVIEAFKDREDYTLLVQAGGISEDPQFQSLPDHIHLRSFVPQLQALQRAACFITHGGTGSLRESILYGKPMLVFPCQYDQPGNAARIAYHGLGIRGNTRRVTPAMVQSMFDRLRTGSGYQQAVEQMQEIFWEQRFCEPGVQFVESHLQATPTVNSGPPLPRVESGWAELS